MRQPIRSGRQPTGSNSACSASHSRVSGSASRAASGRGEEAARSRSQAKLCNQSRVSADASAFAKLSDWIGTVSPRWTHSHFILAAPTDRKTVVQGKSVSVRIDVGGRGKCETKHREDI